MKIFNRGTDAKANAAPAQKAAVAIAPAPAPATPAPAPAPAGPAAASAAPPPAPATPAAAPAPDLALVLDANVKEMSEKIARLASNLESSQTERGSFEAKIEQMEERMRKLSSLTEMISAQYNPFVGEAPTERESLPRPEVGLAPPPVAAASLPAPPLPPPSEAPSLSLSLEPPAPPATPADAPLFPDVAFAQPDAAPAAAQSYAEPSRSPAEAGVYLWEIQPGFEASMLLLGWADMLLKSAGSRQSLLELVNYYHNIGWVGEPARDQILAYADGLVAPAGADVVDWRANVDVHERSLLFVEKLRTVNNRRGS